MQTITNYDNIPQELKDRPQWVLYKLATRDGKTTKIPYDQNGGSRAKTDDPSSWGTFDQCIRYIHRYDGLGYILSDIDDVVVVDLDHCIDENNHAEAWASKIIHDFDSYTEYSQSGHGVHILVTGKKPGTRCRTNDHPNIEIYEERRFLVMTGHLYPSSKGIIQPAPVEIGSLYRELFPQGADGDDKSGSGSAKQDKRKSIPTLSDDELMEKALTARNGDLFKRLWSGDCSDNGNDESASDMALLNILAFWTGCDASRMDRLFRQSGLMREKWERDDYSERTITKAIQDCRQTYTGAASTVERGGFDSGTFCPELRFLTDLGNAEYLIDKIGDSVRYNVDAKMWMHWTGTHWKLDNTGKIVRLATNAVRSMYDLLKKMHDPDKAKQLFSHIKRSESLPRVKAMIEYAETRPDVAIRNAQLDADQWKFNCANGTLDLRTGELLAHNPKDLQAKISPVSYNPDAKCPRWLQFLNEIFFSDSELIEFIHRMVGYCLTGDTREESVFIFYGQAQSGKSKFLYALRQMMGEKSGYIAHTPMTTFVERNDTNTADLASLAGSRIVTASEAGDKQVFNEALLKAISGRDPVTCRFLYCPFFTYVPAFKVVIASNEIPRLRSQSFAMKRRLKIIPFAARFYEPDEGKFPVKDDQLEPKLLAEIDGILTWAVAGCLEWQKKGLGRAKAVTKEIESMFEAQDSLSEFLEACCDLGEDKLASSNELWIAYHKYCADNMLKSIFNGSKVWFVREFLKRDGFSKARGVGGVRLIRGIALKPSDSNGVLWGVNSSESMSA